MYLYCSESLESAVFQPTVQLWTLDFVSTSETAGRSQFQPNVWLTGSFWRVVTDLASQTLTTCRGYHFISSANSDRNFSRQVSHPKCWVSPLHTPHSRGNRLPESGFRHTSDSQVKALPVTPNISALPTRPQCGSNQTILFPIQGKILKVPGLMGSVCSRKLVKCLKCISAI